MLFHLFAIAIVFLSSCYAFPNAKVDLFSLEVVHLNDFHARFEETSRSSGLCSNTSELSCIGGIARLYTAVDRALSNKTNAIFLNAGDNFQGTLWYNIFRWNVTSHFLNMFNTDAYTIGNHEFDHAVAGVVPFMQSMKAPCVVANIDDSEEDTFQGNYKKSTVIEREGKRIGVVGVIWKSTDTISNTGKLKFTDEVEAVNAEADRLVEEEECDIIIVLSHCGLDVDIWIAENASPHISLIVGGHSHSLLYTGKPPSTNDAGKPDSPVGEYPMEKRRPDGGKILIVQASAYTKYLGDITITYDEEGQVVDWDGKPIYLDESVEPDAEVAQLLLPWKEVVDQTGKEELGVTKVSLDASKCRYAECNLGDFLTDAFVHYYVMSNDADDNSWTYAAIAISNPGGIRTSIPKGSITLSGLVQAQPFENTIDVGELQGKYILEMLEFSATSGGFKASNVNFLSMAGIKVYYDLSKAEGERVTRVLLRCQKCSVPHYEPLEEDEMYRIIMPNFLAGGGDGYTMIEENLKNHKVGPIDQDILRDYIFRQSPIIQEEGDRINVIGEEFVQFHPEMIPVS